MSNNAVAQRLVQSFVRFIYQQIDERKFEKDALESLEVAIQCLESVFNLETSEFDKELKRLHMIQEKSIRGVCKIFNEPDGNSVKTMHVDDVSDIQGDGPSTSMEIGPAAAVVSAAQPVSYDDSPSDPLSRVDLFGLFCSSIRIQNDIKNEAETIKIEGNRLMHIEEYYNAIVAYSKAINLNPSNPMFYCNRAAAYSRVGDFKNAAVDCRSALRLDPNYSKAYGRLGMAYSRLQREDMAMCAYANALRLDPTNVDYHNNLQLAEQRLAAVTSANNRSGNDTGASIPNATAASSSSGYNNINNTNASGSHNLNVLNSTVTNTGQSTADMQSINPNANNNIGRFATTITNLATHALHNPSIINVIEQLNSLDNYEELFEQGRVLADYLGNQNPDVFNRFITDIAQQPLSAEAVAAATAAATALARNNAQAEIGGANSSSIGGGGGGGGNCAANSDGVDAGGPSNSTSAITSKTKKRGLNDDDDYDDVDGDDYDDDDDDDDEEL